MRKTKTLDFCGKNSITEHYISTLENSDFPIIIFIFLWLQYRLFITNSATCKFSTENPSCLHGKKRHISNFCDEILSSWIRNKTTPIFRFKTLVVYDIKLRSKKKMLMSFMNAAQNISQNSLGGVRGRRTDEPACFSL